MNDVPAGLPGFSRTQAALRETTEFLAHEIHAPGARAPEWNDLHWTVARAVAVMQGITALLAARLRWHGPPGWQAFLMEQARRARERDEHIGALIVELDAALRSAGVAAVGLKGTALRALALYRAGERPMGDIDLLAAAPDGEAIAGALRGIGYERAFSTPRHLVYEPRGESRAIRYGEHVDNPLKIEVHHAIAEPLPVRRVDITAGLLPADASPGLLSYPDTAALMRHLLLHAAGNMRAHAMRQVQLHDIALLATRLGAADWQRLLATPGSRGGSWWMFPPLALAARYYPGSIAAPIEPFAKTCPRRLVLAASRMTLTDISWSNLRIHAFPGICWSGSPLEAMRFARQRVFPGARAIATLRLAETAQPALKRIPWYGISHARRILRWVIARPPRVQTMVSLRAALAEQALERS